MKYLFLLVLFTGCFIMGVFAQSDYPSERAINQIPPSPSASSMLAFGNTPVHMFTGAPSISIPIYDIQLGIFSFPVSLSHQARGVKVEDIPPSTGMGWNLAAGGVITKTIRGLPDTYPSGYSNSDAGAQVNQYVLDQMSPTERRDFQLSMSDNELDGEPDMYSYSFGPYQGEFYFAADRSVVQRHGDPLRIVADQTSWPYFSKFIIYDPQGNEYHFEDMEETDIGTTLIVNDVTVPQDPLVYVSAWHLSKIVVPAYGEIDFDYRTVTIRPSYQGPLSIYLLKEQPIYDCHNNLLTDPYYGVQAINLITITQKKIEKINFPAGQIDFLYQSTNRTDLTGDQALQQIIIKNRMGATINTFDFTYAYFSNRLFLTQVLEANVGRPYYFYYDQAATLPPRTSKAQDYWGFYNGKTLNTTLVPKINPSSLGGFGLFEYATGADRNPDFNYMKTGALNKVKYPTGGETLFTYEPHRYGNITGHIPVADTSRTISHRLDTLRADASGWSERTFVLDFGQDVHIASTVSGPATQTQITNSAGTPFYGQLSTGSMTPQHHSQTRYLPAGTYKLRAFNYEDDFISRIQITYQKQDSYIIAKDRIGGGLRIKEIADYTSAGVLSSKKTYSYQLDSEPDRSSGILISNYIHEYIQPVTGRMPLSCGISSYQVHYFVRLSASAIPLYSSHGSHVEYSQVLETRVATGEPGGRTLTTYTSSKDIGSGDFYNDTYPYMQQISNEHRRGHIISQQIFKGGTGSFTKIYEIENSYAKLYSLPTDSLDYGTSVATEYRDLTNPTINIYIDNSYALFRDVYKQTSSVERRYEGAGVYIESTDYHYDNPLHLQPTRVVSLQSDGSEIVTTISYPHDYHDASGFIYKMKLQHQLSLPIEQVQYRQQGTARTVISGLITTYKDDDRGLPDIVYTLESMIPITQSSFKFSNRGTPGVLPPAGSPSTFSRDTRYQPQVHYVHYDSYGNPLEVKRPNGPSTAFLWGYEGQFLVGQVTNATYAELQALLTTATINQLHAYNVTESFIRSTLQTVRSARQQSLVSTFTHIPLTGLGSSTDPNGRMTIYEYDGQKRLKWIRDHHNRIRTHYQYHLRP